PNPKHWASNAGSEGSEPALVPVVLRIIHDESTAANLFEQGKLDVLTRVPQYDYAKLRDKGLLRVDPMVATYYLSFNARKPPFDDREWRRAVSGSIRRDEITQALGSGETPARSWVPKGLEGYIPWEPTAPVFASSVAAVRAKLKAMKKPPQLRAAFDSGSRNA